MILKKQKFCDKEDFFQTEQNGTFVGSACTIIGKRSNMVRNFKTEEPVWTKYITEKNLPTDDLKFCVILLAWKQLKN